MIAGVARRPGTVLAVVAAVGGSSIFAWNTLMGQSSRHPAPLFPPKQEAARADAPRRPEAAMPLPVPRPEMNLASAPADPSASRLTGNDLIGSLIRTTNSTSPAPEKARAPGKLGDPRPVAAVRSSEPKPTPAGKADPKVTAPQAKPASEAKAGAAGRPADAKLMSARIAGAQRALVKLGYGPIALDGMMGPTTGQALSKFERDRKLPVTGALGAQTIGKLAALSGLRIE